MAKPQIHQIQEQIERSSRRIGKIDDKTIGIQNRFVDTAPDSVDGQIKWRRLSFQNDKGVFFIPTETIRDYVRNYVTDSSNTTTSDSVDTFVAAQEILKPDNIIQEKELTAAENIVYYTSVYSNAGVTLPFRVTTTLSVKIELIYETHEVVTDVVHQSNGFNGRIDVNIPPEKWVTVVIYFYSHGQGFSSFWINTGILNLVNLIGTPAPFPAENLAASQSQNTSSITLTWDFEPFLFPGDAIEIQRGGLTDETHDVSNWQQLSTIPGFSIKYSDVDVAPGQSYAYRIRFISKTGISTVWSNIVEGHTLPTNIGSTLTFQPNALTNLVGYYNKEITSVLTVTEALDTAPIFNFIDSKGNIFSDGVPTPSNNNFTWTSERFTALNPRTNEPSWAEGKVSVQVAIPTSAAAGIPESDSFVGNTAVGTVVATGEFLLDFGPPNLSSIHISVEDDRIDDNDNFTNRNDVFIVPDYAGSHDLPASEAFNDFFETSEDDNTSGIYQIQISNDPEFTEDQDQWILWEEGKGYGWNLGVAGRGIISFPVSTSELTVYARVRDRAGNISQSVRDDIILILDKPDEKSILMTGLDAILSISLSWGLTPEKQVASYLIYKAEGAGDSKQESQYYTEVLGRDTINYSDTNVESDGTLYNYSIKLKDQWGAISTGWTNEVAGLTAESASGAGGPGPGDLVAPVFSYDDSFNHWDYIHLAWTAVTSYNFSFYKLYRHNVVPLPGGTFANATVLHTGMEPFYKDADKASLLVDMTNPYKGMYWISAVNETGGEFPIFDIFDIAQITGALRTDGPSAPLWESSLSIVDYGFNHLVLTGANPHLANTGEFLDSYKIFRAEINKSGAAIETGAYTHIGDTKYQVSGDVYAIFNDRGIAAGREYYYKARGINYFGWEGDFSAVLTGLGSALPNYSELFINYVDNGAFVRDDNSGKVDNWGGQYSASTNAFKYDGRSVLYTGATLSQEYIFAQPSKSYYYSQYHLASGTSPSGFVIINEYAVNTGVASATLESSYDLSGITTWERTGFQFTTQSDTNRMELIISGKGDTRPWTPSADATGMFMLLQAATMGLSHNDLVDDWFDDTSEANDFFQTTGFRKPTYHTNVHNSLPGVWFDGNNDEMQSTGFDYPTSSYSFFFMIDPTPAAGNQDVLFEIDDSNIEIYSQRSADNTVSLHDGVAWRTFGAAVTGAQLLEFIFDIDTTNVQVLRNGTSIGSTTVATFGITGGLAGGGGIYLGHAGNNNWATGYVLDTAFLSHSSSTDQREKFEGYFLHRYGIESDLPGGHTYLSAPPTESQDEITYFVDGIQIEEYSATDSPREFVSSRTISADRLQAHFIVGDMISGGTIQGRHIEALTISGELITAGAITTDKITIGKGTNLIFNGMMTYGITGSDIDYWPGWVISGSEASQFGGLEGSALHGDQMIQLQPVVDSTETVIRTDENYLVRVDSQSNYALSLYAEEGQPGTIDASGTVRILEYDNVKSYIQYMTGKTETGGQSLESFTITGSSSTDPFSKFEVLISSVDFHANTQYLGFEVSNSGNRNIDFDSIQLEEGNIVSEFAFGQTTIDEGWIRTRAIQTEHLQADIIDASHIKADAVTALKIAAGSISGGHIIADTITGGHIVANTISGGHIQASTIETDRLTTTFGSNLVIDGGFTRWQDTGTLNSWDTTLTQIEQTSGNIPRYEEFCIRTSGSSGQNIWNNDWIRIPKDTGGVIEPMNVSLWLRRDEEPATNAVTVKLKPVDINTWPTGWNNTSDWTDVLLTKQYDVIASSWLRLDQTIDSSAWTIASAEWFKVYIWPMIDNASNDRPDTYVDGVQITPGSGVQDWKAREGTIIQGNWIKTGRISSSNYVEGSTGWDINLDGGVEFATGIFRDGVRIRGNAIIEGDAIISGAAIVAGTVLGDRLASNFQNLLFNGGFELGRENSPEPVWSPPELLDRVTGGGFFEPSGPFQGSRCVILMSGGHPTGEGTTDTVLDRGVRQEIFIDISGQQTVGRTTLTAQGAFWPGITGVNGVDLDFGFKYIFLTSSGLYATGHTFNNLTISSWNKRSWSLDLNPIYASSTKAYFCVMANPDIFSDPESIFFDAAKVEWTNADNDTSGFEYATEYTEGVPKNIAAGVIVEGQLQSDVWNISRGQGFYLDLDSGFFNLNTSIDKFGSWINFGNNNQIKKTIDSGQTFFEYSPIKKIKENLGTAGWGNPQVFGGTTGNAIWIIASGIHSADIDLDDYYIQSVMLTDTTTTGNRHAWKVDDSTGASKLAGETGTAAGFAMLYSVDIGDTRSIYVTGGVDWSNLDASETTIAKSIVVYVGTTRFNNIVN